MDFMYLAAIDVIKRANEGQKRKYTNEPYISHPFAVAGLVAAVTTDDDMIVAALLHDVVEDTTVTLETINGIFGGRIAQMVSDLTDVSVLSDGNRAERKKIDRKHTAKASMSAKTIKLADLIDNTKTITAYDKKFAKVYMAEKRLLLKVLKEGNIRLFKIASDLVENFYATEIE